MNIEINGVLQKIGIKELKDRMKEMGLNTDNLEKRMQIFKLNDNFIKPDPDNKDQIMVPKIWGIPTQYTQVNADGESEHVRYYGPNGKQPHPSIMGKYNYTPRQIFFEEGLKEIDLAPRNLKRDCALMWFLLGAPKYASQEFYLFIPAMKAASKIKERQLIKDATDMFLDKNAENYVKDKELGELAKRLGIVGVDQLEYIELRDMLISRAEREPVRVMGVLESKESAVVSLLIDLLEYKLLYKDETTKKFHLTAFEDDNKKSRAVSSKTFYNCKGPKNKMIQECAEWLLNFDTEGNLSTLRKELEFEKSRLLEIATVREVDVDEIRQEVTLRKVAVPA